jgi:MarR family transcriptional regulator, organic hydroperoxide resistance regulator
MAHSDDAKDERSRRGGGRARRRLEPVATGAARQKRVAQSKSGSARSSRARSPSMEEPFPPLSISSEAFLADGTDAEFRQLIYNFLGLAALFLDARECFAAFIGVSAPQYSMMVAIGEARETTATSLAARLHVSTAFVAAEIGKLVSRQIVARRPSTSDRRSAILTLTPRGKSLIRHLGPYRRVGNDGIFGSLTRPQADQFKDLTSLLLANAQKALAELNHPDWVELAARPRKDAARSPRRGARGTSIQVARPSRVARS